jgi:hypothetical protein
VPGSPIRKSPDQSLVADSPRHIAGSHVLHRLLMPRHPPCALKNFEHTTLILHKRAPRRSLQLTREPTQKTWQVSLIRMLASTVQFSKNRQPPHTHHTQQARAAEALCDTKGPRQHHTPTTRPPALPRQGKNQTTRSRGRWPVSSGPNSVPGQAIPRVHRSHSPPGRGRTGGTS